MSGEAGRVGEGPRWFGALPDMIPVLDDVLESHLILLDAHTAVLSAARNVTLDGTMSAWPLNHFGHDEIVPPAVASVQPDPVRASWPTKKSVTGRYTLGKGAPFQ